MATDVKKIKFVYFVYVHPKAFHLTRYKQNLIFDLCQLYWKLPETTINLEHVELDEGKSDVLPFFRRVSHLEWNGDLTF